MVGAAWLLEWPLFLAMVNAILPVLLHLAGADCSGVPAVDHPDPYIRTCLETSRPRLLSRTTRPCSRIPLPLVPNAAGTTGRGLFLVPKAIGCGGREGVHSALFEDGMRLQSEVSVILNANRKS